MERFYKYFIWILPLFIAGCEKVIDVDLNEAAPEIVIEGNIKTNPDFALVKISKTSSFFDTLPSEKVSGALVTILSNLGEKYLLYDVGEGEYKSDNLRLKTGATYHLYIEAEGEIYEANSKLTETVPIDSLQYYYEDRYSFFEKGYYLNVYFSDPPQIENYYRIKIYKNGLLASGIDDFIVFDDNYVDGNSVEISLLNDWYEVNDTVEVQLISIDKSAYDYFKTFIDLVNNNPGSAAPANPVSNISNGALGYFSAWSSDTKSVIIREN